MNIIERLKYLNFSTVAFWIAMILIVLTLAGLADKTTEALVWLGAAVISRFEEHLRQIRHCMNTLTLLQVNEQMRKDNIKAKWEAGETK